MSTLQPSLLVYPSQLLQRVLTDVTATRSQRHMLRCAASSPTLPWWIYQALNPHFTLVGVSGTYSTHFTLVEYQELSRHTATALDINPTAPTLTCKLTSAPDGIEPVAE